MKKYKQFLNEKLYSISNKINKFLIINDLQNLTHKKKCIVEYDEDYNLSKVYYNENFDESLAYQLIEFNKSKGFESEIKNVYFHKTEDTDKILVAYSFGAAEVFCIFAKGLARYENVKTNGEPLQLHLMNTIKLNENLLKSIKGINKYNL